MRKRWGVGVMIAAFCFISNADTLFMDTFDRADSSDVNTNAAVCQSGHAAPLVYETAAYNTPDSVEISQSNVVLNLDGDGNGQIRLIPQYELSDSAEAIAAAGGFEVSCDVLSGIGYEGTVHSSYSTSYIISQEGIAENAGAGSGNAFQSLYVKVFGTGRILIYSQGALLSDVVSSVYGGTFDIGEKNNVRLVVDPAGFLTAGNASVSVYINGSEAVTTNFTWKNDNSAFVALEAVNQTASFDNFKIKEIEPASPLLFADSFDRADSTNVSAGASANQYGDLSPADYETVASDSFGLSSISGQVVRLNSDALTRLVPQFNISDQSDAIAAAGGFSISYSVDAGVDYPGTVHGSYASSLILSQEGIAENPGAATGNTWHGLYAKIAGNGQVRVYLQGVLVFVVNNADYGNAWMAGQWNNVRLDVETDGFLTTSTNVFSLYINNAEVCSTNLNWKTANDLSVAWEADMYSAEFDNLQVRVLESDETLMFSDSFGRSDNADVNESAFANQSGGLAPLSYGIYSNNTPLDVQISANEVLMTLDGNGQMRLVPEVDLADHAADLTENGGFEISYAVDTGIDYVGSVHGIHASSIVLSQESMVKNVSSGIANVWQGLFVTVKGNGQVQVNSQGTNLLDVTVNDWGTSELIDSVNAGLGIGAHNVRLVVQTDGFLTTSANTFILYVNDLLVGSADYAWKSSNDTSLALEAINYSARFDDLVIRKIVAGNTETSTGVPYTWLDSYYAGLIIDADYENAANADTDGDGLTGLEEYLTGTDPTDSSSVFAFSAPVFTADGMVVTWPSVSGELYDISMKAQLSDVSWTPVAIGITGLVVETSYTATVSDVTGFFKVELQ